MKLSTRSRYGVRLMQELALKYNEGYTFLKSIAKEQDISEKYLSHLVILLRANGLIVSSRGAHGGYRLAKDPSLITLKDIVQALEGSLSLVECVTNPSVCLRSSKCSTRAVWMMLDQKIAETLSSITLKDLGKCQPMPGMESKKKSVKNINKETRENSIEEMSRLNSK